MVNEAKRDVATVSLAPISHSKGDLAIRLEVSYPKIHIGETMLDKALSIQMKRIPFEQHHVA